MESEKYHTSDPKFDTDPSILKGAQVICLYFSAAWCPPCRKFTPLLADFYNVANENDRKVEIIFCSCDKNLQCFKKYFKTMPWIAHPFTPKVI
jgi:nucleoredoxin